MAMVRARTPSLPIESLHLFAQHADADLGLLRDEPAIRAFGARVSAGLGQSLADERRLHGRWAQDLFRAVLISLDAVTLIPVTSRLEHELVNAVALYGGGAVSAPGLIADETRQPFGLMMTVRAPGAPEQLGLGSRLSSICSARYIVATKDPVSGSVKQIRHRADPTLTRLAETARTRSPKRVMPVQVFRQIPTDPPAAG